MMLRSRRRPPRAALRHALTAAIVCALAPHVHAGRMLFDATKSEMAGNADWVIDSDSELSGNSNPQRVPTPAQSGITATTPETYWKGGISAWGVTMVKHGNLVESLPRVGGRISYGDATNAQDLSHYKTYVVCEPNNLFTAAEKTAIVNFVAGGGGLFVVSDHDNADRDNDGSDAVDVWNDLFLNNGVANNPFGMAVNYDSFSQVSTNVSAAGEFKSGTEGTATNLEFNAGASFTISTAANSTVKAAVWKNGTATNSNVMMAYASYGLGRVVALGDSSPADDGTGDTGDTLFDGWPTGTNGVLISNATDWLGASLQSTYDATTGGSFGTATSWTGTVPDNINAVVDFKGAIAAASTITLDRARSIGLLRFDSTKSYTIAGTSTLTIGGSTPIPTIASGVIVTSGSHTISTPITSVGRATFNTVPSTSTLTIGTLAMTLDGAILGKTGLGRLDAERITGQSILNVTGGTVKFTGTAAVASQVRFLNITTGASVDLGLSGIAVINSTPATSLTQMQADIKARRLLTSASDLTVGYGMAGTLGITSFGGLTVDATTLLARATVPGDATLDLTVNFDDLVPLAQNYNATGKIWSDGDFTNDGLVNFDDLVVLAQHYNTSTTGALVGDASFVADWALAQSFVPEPGMIMFATIATGFFLRRRRSIR